MKRFTESTGKKWREEVARHVEVQAAVGEAGRVVDLCGGQLDVHALGVGGDGLAQRLRAVEHASGRSAGNLNAPLRHQQAVAFGVLDVLGHGEVDVTFAGLHLGQLARGGLDVAGQVVGHALQGGVSFGIADGGG